MGPVLRRWATEEEMEGPTSSRELRNRKHA